MLGIDSAVQDRWRLGEQRESALERRQRLIQKEIDSHTVTVTKDSGRDRSNLLAQLGRPLHINTVIQKLKQCNSRLHFERAISDHTLWGAYLLTKERTAAGTLEDKKIHLFTLGSDGIMPEFTVIHKKMVRVPRKELIGNTEPTRDVKWDMVETYVDQTRGWRVPLVRLLHANLITRGDVERHFGWNPSKTSEKWHQFTS